MPHRASPWGALAELLCAREEPGESLPDATVRALAGRDLLLVLDNCEHVLDGARDVATRLLDDCPGVTVLATSREPLRLDAERYARCRRLPADDAAELFAERAARALPGVHRRACEH